MDKKILGIAVGIPVILATGLGVSLVSTAVSSKPKEDTPVVETTPNVDLSIYQEQIDKLNADLTASNNLITAKNTKISELESTITSLNNEKADLLNQIDELNSLLDNDGSIDYQTQINELNAQVESLTTQISEYETQVNTLTQEKNELLTQVSDLQSQVDSLTEELANYKAMGVVDKYSIESFNGTWYLDGKFDDYYTIKDGLIIHNDNEDSGAVYKSYMQMRFLMNTAGGIDVTLSDDGSKFLNEETGEYYHKYFINECKDVESDVGMFTGKYTSADTYYNLKSDNTLEYYDGTTMYYGAYTSTALYKNIGGNEMTIHTITTNVNIGEDKLTNTFKHYSTEKYIHDIDNDVYYNFSSVEPYYLISDSSYKNNGINDFLNKERGFFLTITVKFDNAITLKPGSSVSLYMLYKTNVSTNRFSYTTVNFGGYGSNALNSSYILDGSYYYKYNFYNCYDYTICSDTFYIDLYYYNSNASYIATLDVKNILAYTGEYYINSKIIAVNPEDRCTFADKFIFTDMMVNNSANNQISCVPIYDYINGTYSNSDMSVSINNNSAVITKDSTEITPATFTVDSYTDGYDIYQTSTISYVQTVDETDVTYTLVLNFKNDKLVSSTLDGVDISLSE